MDKADLKQTADENFLNWAVHNMLIAHIVCFTLLAGTKLDVLFVPSTAKGLKSLFQFGSIGTYLFYMFKAEFSLRKYRPQYNKGSTSKNFNLMSAIAPKAPTFNFAADTAIMGSVCSQSIEGNSIIILWLELLFFLSNIFIVFVSLVGSMLASANVKEAKSADKLLVFDKREGKTTQHIFSL